MRVKKIIPIIVLFAAISACASDAADNERSYLFTADYNYYMDIQPSLAINTGLTSANVRLYFADNESVRQWYPSYRLFDLNQIEHYHEFILSREAFKLVFTTEEIVRNFRFLEIQWNDDFFESDKDESVRLYNVSNILYSLDELTPKTPLVIMGANLGCSLAVNGFSFEDTSGETNYFSFLQSGETGFIVISEF